MKNTISLLAGLGTVFCVAVLFSAPVNAIKKCKDAEGKWHYGDVAVRACENSKVTTLDDRGFVESELAAPKTEEELRLEKEAMLAEEAEQKRIKAERDERARILSIYENESDIDRQRDNQLNSVQGNIDVHEAYLKGMDSRIARFEKKRSEATAKRIQDNMDKQIVDAQKRKKSSQEELAALKVQKANIVKKFEREKAVYRELKKSK